MTVSLDLFFIYCNCSVISKLLDIYPEKKKAQIESKPFVCMQQVSH